MLHVRHIMHIFIPSIDKISVVGLSHSTVGACVRERSYAGLTQMITMLSINSFAYILLEVHIHSGLHKYIYCLSVTLLDCKNECC